jgi:tetratricopeptide (TPR) repeat protein
MAEASPSEVLLLLGVEPTIQKCTALLEKKDKLSQAQTLKLYEVRAWAYASDEKYREAREDYNQLLQLRPGDIEARRLRALAMAGCGAYQEAMDELQDLMRKHPRVAAPYASAGGLVLRAGEIKSCVEYCDKAIALDKDLAYAYYIRAMALTKLENWQGCLSDVDHCIRLDPLDDVTTSEDKLFLRGVALSHLERHKEAIQCFAAARNANPSSYNATLGLWSAYLAERKFYLAYRMAGDLVRLEPKTVAAWDALAYSSIALGRLDEASEAASKMIALAPTDPGAFYRAATVCRFQKQHAEAIKHYDRALELDPQHHWSLIGKAETLATCSDPKVRDGKKALGLAEKACEVTKWQNPFAIITLACAYAECGDFDNAQQFTRKALELPSLRAEDREECEQMLRSFEQKKPIHRDPDPAQERRSGGPWSRYK